LIEAGLTVRHARPRHVSHNPVFRPWSSASRTSALTAGARYHPAGRVERRVRNRRLESRRPAATSTRRPPTHSSPRRRPAELIEAASAFATARPQARIAPMPHPSVVFLLPERSGDKLRRRRRPQLHRHVRRRRALWPWTSTIHSRARAIRPLVYSQPGIHRAFDR